MHCKILQAHFSKVIKYVVSFVKDCNKIKKRMLAVHIILPCAHY